MALLNEVFIKKPKSSNFNLSRVNRTTMAPGVLYPMLVEECLPGDIINLDITSLIKTYPLQAPVMGQFKVQTDVFFSATRNYVPELRSNAPYFDPTNVSFPVITAPTIPQANVIPECVKSITSKDSLMNYLGVPYGYGRASDSSFVESNNFNAIPLLMYYDIFRNYYCNTQETTFPVFVNNLWSRELSMKSFDLLAFNELFDIIAGGEKNVNSALLSAFNALDVVESVFSGTFGGLCLRTYKPDVNNTWLNTAKYDSIVSNASISVDNDSFTINQVRTGNKLMKYLERGLVSGGRFGDWVRAQFGVNTDDKLDIPEFFGSSSSLIQFSDVLQTSDKGGTNEPLGTLGGRGTSSGRSSNINFRCKENGYLMVIVSLVPTVDYYQGTKSMLRKTMYSDCFAPALDNIGFQTVPLSQLCDLPRAYHEVGDDGADNLWDRGYDPNIISVGYQPAWTEYMTATNELHGDFVDSLNYWALSRDFTPFGITDRPVASDVSSYPVFYANAKPTDPLTPVSTTSYVNPTLFNYAFIDTSISADNFMCQFKFDLLMRRHISKQIMPTL